MPLPIVSVDLRYQVHGILGPRNGGVGSQLGHALGVYDALPNFSGDVMALGSLVKMNDRSSLGGYEGGYSVILTSDEHDTGCIGVVAGTYIPATGQVFDTDVPALGVAYVVRQGWAYVLLAEDVTFREWLGPSVTPGQAAGSPVPIAGIVARAAEDGTAGNRVRAFVDGGAAGGTGTSSAGFVSVVTLEAGDFVDDVTAGFGTYKGVPFAGTLEGVILEAPVAATAEVDILRNNASVPLALGTNSVCGGDYPALAGATWLYYTPTVNWDTAVAAQDVFRLEVRSADAGCPRLTAQLVIRQT